MVAAGGGGGGGACCGRGASDIYNCIYNSTNSTYKGNQLENVICLDTHINATVILSNQLQTAKFVMLILKMVSHELSPVVLLIESYSRVVVATKVFIIISHVK